MIAQQNELPCGNNTSICARDETPKCEDQKGSPCQSAICNATPCKPRPCPVTPCPAKQCPVPPRPVTPCTIPSCEPAPSQAPPCKPEQCANYCTKSVVAPTPLVSVNPCERSKCNDEPFCARVIKNGCPVIELTQYGKEFTQCTGKIAVKCLCVKFNGLQDSCKHACCCNKRACLNIPFPTCPPAKKWKNDYICCKSHR